MIVGATASGPVLVISSVCPSVACAAAAVPTDPPAPGPALHREGLAEGALQPLRHQTA